MCFFNKVCKKASSGTVSVGLTDVIRHLRGCRPVSECVTTSIHTRMTELETSHILRSGQERWMCGDRRAWRPVKVRRWHAGMYNYHCVSGCDSEPLGRLKWRSARAATFLIMTVFVTEWFADGVLVYPVLFVFLCVCMFSKVVEGDISLKVFWGDAWSPCTWGFHLWSRAASSPSDTKSAVTVMSLKPVERSQLCQNKSFMISQILLFKKK